LSGEKFSGVYAAVLTPRDSNERVDTAALAALIRFQLSKGISSFALNGATGEFCLTKPEELRVVLQTVREASEDKARILCGVGATSIAVVKELAVISEEAGAVGLLLPMPYFFRYQQEDLDAFCRAAAESTKLPILLYNLPQFSTGLEKETVRALIAQVPNIIGIKDSGGSLDILRDLTAHGGDACRIVGNDVALRGALREGVCDGVVSGIACVVPELIGKLYSQGGHAASPEFDESWRRLTEIARQLDAMPTPWALKWIAEARGVIHATFAQPTSVRRREQGEQLKTWFREWFSNTVPGGAL
jgi:4-hydroxy-tetrahydrodipicolinate synthase